MRTWGVVLGVLMLASAAGAEEVLREFSWATLHARGKLAGGELMTADRDTSFASLAVENNGQGQATIPVLTIDNPGVTEATYAVRGQVRYQDIEGKACLEMWSHFPGGERYSTRTLAAAGPLRSLEGSSGWRSFSLPFFIRDEAKRPERLVINVVLPGKGKVRLSPLQLVQYAAGENPLAGPTQWWGDRQGGLIGAIFGVLFGTLGAVVGVLGSRGRARAFVLGTLRISAGVGTVSLVLGFVSLAFSQPYAVYFPLFLIGILATALPLGLLRIVRRQYEQIELRRMKAQDAAPS